MNRIWILALLCMTCYSGISFAQECPYSKKYSEGAIDCEAAVELDVTIERDYGLGVAESKTWSNAFAQCKKIGKELETNLFPVPVAESQTRSVKKLDGDKVRYSYSRGFYCTGL